MTEDNLARLKRLGRYLLKPAPNGARAMTDEEVLALPPGTVAELERREAAQSVALEVLKEMTRALYPPPKPEPPTHDDGQTARAVYPEAEATHE